MTPALTALAAADFGALADVWADPGHHVDDVNGDVADRLIAEFFVRARAPAANPIGQVIAGPAGAGKTHLLGALRRRVWAREGWFVHVDLGALVEFWGAAAFGFVESLARPTPAGRTQGGAALLAALKAVGAHPAAREAAARAQRDKAGALDLMLAMLAAAEPERPAHALDAARALALMESRETGVALAAAAWLRGDAPAPQRLAALGLPAPPPPRETLRGLIWLMALGGPTLIAVEGLDALAAEAAAGGAGANRAAALLQGAASGLSEWHEDKRRALTLIACLPATWGFVQSRAAAPVANRFRALRPLGGLASAARVEALLARRLAPAFAGAGFVPPQPAWPFAREAIASGVGLTPRAILRGAAAHRDACIAEANVRACARLDTPEPPAAAPADSLAALDEDFAAACAAPSAAPADLAAALADACRFYIAELDPAEGFAARVVAEPDRRHPALDAEIVIAGEDGRERRLGFCAPQEEGAALAARLSAALAASGVEAGLSGRRLVAWRAAPEGETGRAFVEAGGVFAPPIATDLARIAALRRLAADARAPFAAWLRWRKPMSATALFQAAGAAAPPPAEPPRPPPPPPPPPPLPPPLPPAPQAPAAPDLILGPGAVLRLASLGRPLAIFAPDPQARAGLLGRLVAEAARLGAPSLVVALEDRFGRLAGPFAREDYAPGAGRPLALPPLPDFAGLDGADAETAETRERAVELALAALEPHLLGRGARAIKLRGTLADALRHFARTGGGALDDLVRLLAQLPENASRIPEAGELAREISDQLLAALATDPLLQAGDAPANLAGLFTGGPRVSVVSLAGLAPPARAGFVHQAQMALFSWTRRRAGGPPCLYALDDAQVFAPAKEASAARRSALALLAPARRAGLGLVFAASEPAALDPALAAEAATVIRAEAGGFVLETEGREATRFRLD